MPLSKDTSGKRFVELEIELPGSPEQIWQALATGPGYTAWFLPTEIEPREGGSVRFDFGGGLTSSGHVTTWQPPTRFGYEEVDWSGDAPPLATEVIIEAKDGGTCTLRMVHSLFTDKDDWDKELEGMEGGWPPFFRLLRLYLRFFPGMHAASARSTGAFNGAPMEAFRAVCDKLGLTGNRAGDPCDISANSAPRLAGVVEDVSEWSQDGGAITLRLEHPAPGAAMIGAFHWGDSTSVAASLYFYGDDADAVLKRELAAWDAWMAEHFQPPERAR